MSTRNLIRMVWAMWFAALAAFAVLCWWTFTFDLANGVVTVRIIGAPLVVWMGHSLAVRPPWKLKEVA